MRVSEVERQSYATFCFDKIRWVVARWLRSPYPLAATGEIELTGTAFGLCPRKCWVQQVITVAG